LSKFYQAVAQLIEQVSNARENDVRFVQELADKPPFAFIDWLEAQPIFPKFYWQSRDTRDASFFFLPQIELIRFDDKWSLAANVSHEKHRTLATLNKLLVDITPIRTLQSEIVHVTHTPDENGWNHLVEKVLHGIEQKEFKKVVLARKTSLQLDSNLSAAQLLKASYAQNHHSFHFLLSIDTKHSFMGSTPESVGWHNWTRSQCQSGFRTGKLVNARYKKSE